ncbi:hypothetical protein AWC03_02840 [Mycobacterium europaeum]|uniref:helix-turn-helix domain-containing protein n=1 Tax=Mycobacterium europaeum TaxID=761804 RepID=UPI000A1691D1|nr:helix-turn-helix domain-containing protein [Mycobacterium europaeum]ORV65301.1 hypothetical protein AWC03_02840 [Mycobacterium europaeum]
MTIQRFSGVLLDLDEADYLADVLEHAARLGRPSARVDDLIRRLRREVGKSEAPSADANKNVSARANQPDPGQVRAHDLLTAAEAAAVIGCSGANVRYLRAHGHLPAHRAGSRWLYPAAPVVEYAEHRASKRR